jgi:hypothetical protein
VFIVDVSPLWGRGMCAGKAGAKSTTPDAAEVTGGERPHEETDQDRPRTDESGLLAGRCPFRQPREAPQCSGHGLTDGKQVALAVPEPGGLLPAPPLAG